MVILQRTPLLPCDQWTGSVQRTIVRLSVAAQVPPEHAHAEFWRHAHADALRHEHSAAALHRLIQLQSEAAAHNLK